MAENTDFKLTTVGGTLLFNFNVAAGATAAASGVGLKWQPSNENQSAQILGEAINLPFYNSTSYFNSGIGTRNIVIQGPLLDDTTYRNQWRLSRAVHDREIKKLWLGEDWFYYVLGLECRFVRDEANPLLYRYVASFNAFNPTYYAANSTDGVTVVPTNPTQVGTFTDGVAKNMTADLTGTTSNSSEYNHWDIEPIFIITSTTDSNVTSISFEDEEGRKATLTQAIATTAQRWVVMPFSFRETVEGFIPKHSIAYKGKDATHPAITAWIPDLNLYDGTTNFTVASGKPTSTAVTLSTNTAASGYRGKWNWNYPRFKCLDSSATIAIIVNGTTTGVTVDAQYLYTRM